MLQLARDAGALRATLDSVFASPVYRWAEEPRAIRFVRDAWTQLGEWLTALRAGNPAAFRLLGLVVLIAAVGLLLHGTWVVWRTARTAWATDPSPAGTSAPDVRDAGWYLRAADAAAADGRTADALQLAFIGLALRLERHGLLQYHASKTPAECAREARLTGADRTRLRGLVGVLYGHAFGGDALGRDEWRRWREDIDRPWHAPAH